MKLEEAIVYLLASSGHGMKIGQIAQVYIWNLANPSLRRREYTYDRRIYHEVSSIMS